MICSCYLNNYIYKHVTSKCWSVPAQYNAQQHVRFAVNRPAAWWLAPSRLGRSLLRDADTRAIWSPRHHTVYFSPLGLCSSRLQHRNTVGRLACGLGEPHSSRAAEQLGLRYSGERDGEAIQQPTFLNGTNILLYFTLF